MAGVRVVHYPNQFFGQRGGEEQAHLGPALVEGPVGPGAMLAQKLGPGYSVVGTLICGDNYKSDAPEDRGRELVELARHLRPDLVLAGPAFAAGRYSIACAAFGVADKRRSAQAAARLARHTLGCAGVIVSKDGGGQADVDLAECTEACEGVGLKTVLVVKEEGGEAGAAYPLVVVSPRADAIVTTGNGTEHIHVFNRVERLIGGDALYEGQSAASADLELPYNYIVGSVDFEGDLLIRTREL